MHVYDARFLREGALGKLVPNATALEPLAYAVSRLASS
jgi:hypothetical protein